MKVPDRDGEMGPLRVLIVEDSEDDALLLLRELRHAGYEPRWQRIETADALMAALDREPWDIVIADFTMPELTHSSPVYDEKNKVVAIGSNDCKVYLFNARDGKLLWEFQAGGEIKASLCIDDKRKLLIFGAFDGYIYMLNLSSGELFYKFKTLAAIYSTPVIYENNVIVSSLDKKIYSINLDTKGLNWDYQCGGRAMTTPLIVEQSIWVGATDGVIYEIEASSGKLLSIFRTTERITNKPVYDLKSKTLFVPTYANEIYAVKV